MPLYAQGTSADGFCMGDSVWAILYGRFCMTLNTIALGPGPLRPGDRYLSTRQKPWASDSLGSHSLSSSRRQEYLQLTTSL